MPAEAGAVRGTGERMSERGIEDGFADVIEHFAAGVATEVHGPATARGRE